MVLEVFPIIKKLSDVTISKAEVRTTKLDSLEIPTDERPARSVEDIDVVVIVADDEKKIINHYYGITRKGNYDKISKEKKLKYDRVVSMLLTS